MSLFHNTRFWIARKISHFLLYHHFKGASYLRRYLCSRLVPPVTGPIVCSTIYGFDVLVDAIVDEGLERSIYYFGEYEAGTLSVLKNFLSKGDVFLDVGANIGFISLFVAKIVGELGSVYSVEPHPEIYKILTQNISLNHMRNILSLNCALGNNIGEAKIYDGRDKIRGSASLIPPSTNPSELGKKSGHMVTITTVDKLIKTGAIGCPRIMKIDVEGMELKVLEGSRTLLSSPEAPILCVEFSDLQSNKYEDLLRMYKFIKSINEYSCFKLMYGKSVPSRLVKISGEKHLPHHDNVFCLPIKHQKMNLWK